MSIVSCPRCGDKVSVPPASSPSALVQCPLCAEEYFLSDALIQLPPMLVVVGGHAAAGKDSDYRLAEPVTAGVGHGVFDTTADASATLAPRPQLRTVSRQRRPEKSAVGEIIKVVLGGVAGLAGGLLVLWWGFGVDVGELAPKVSKVQYLRFLVPPKLWDRSVPSGTTSGTIDTLGTTAPKGNGQAKGKKAGPGGSRDGGVDHAFGGGLGTSELESSPPGADSIGQSDKGAKVKAKGDEEPLLTLDPLGLNDPAASKPSDDLKIDDPLLNLKPLKEPATKGPSEKGTADATDTPKPQPPGPSDEPSGTEKPDGDKPESDSPPKSGSGDAPEPAKSPSPSSESPETPGESSPPAKAEVQEPSPE